MSITRPFPVGATLCSRTGEHCRPHLHATSDSWRVDETSVKVKSIWMDLYRAVDSQGTMVEFHLSPPCDA